MGYHLNHPDVAIFMAGPKPMLDDYGIYRRLESCGCDGGLRRFDQCNLDWTTAVAGEGEACQLSTLCQLHLPRQCSNLCYTGRIYVVYPVTTFSLSNLKRLGGFYDISCLVWLELAVSGDIRSLAHVVK